MAQSGRISSGLAQRYARAIIELSKDRKVLAKVEQDLQSLQTIISESADFSAFLEASFLSQARRQAVLDDVSKKGKFQAETANFLGVVNAQGRLALLPQLIDAVQAQLAAERGEITARVETAYVLSAAQQKQLSDSLSDMTGAKVLLEASLNEDLIGGIVVTVGSTRIDSSVAGRLSRLRGAMQSCQSHNDNLTILNNNTKKEA